MNTLDTKIAYFSMEIGIDDEIPSYSGGLGILAGDSILSAADLGIPMVAVALIYSRGYLNQGIDENGRQYCKGIEFNPDKKQKK